MKAKGNISIFVIYFAGIMTCQISTASHFENLPIGPINTRLNGEIADVGENCNQGLHGILGIFEAINGPEKTKKICPIRCTAFAFDLDEANGSTGHYCTVHLDYPSYQTDFTLPISESACDQICQGLHTTPLPAVDQ